MEKQIDKVFLECSEETVNDREFSLEHATNLLRMKNNGGWRLPKASPFEFKKDAITSKSGKRNSKIPESNGGHKGGSKPPK